MFYRQSTYNDRGLNGEATQLLCRSRGGHGPRADRRGGQQKRLDSKTSGSRLLICRRFNFQDFSIYELPTFMIYQCMIFQDKAFRVY